MDTKERLQIGADLLAAIERNRARTDDPGLGSGIERSIIERELRELERDVQAPSEPVDSHVLKLRRRSS